MLGSLSGKIKIKKDNYCILEVSGVGYKVFVNRKVASSLAMGKKAELCLYHQIGENISKLYGFNDFSEVDFFELLLSVSGVGPVAAMAIMDGNEIKNVRKAIIGNDENFFMSVKGIGRRGARKIIIDLKSKIGKEEEGDLANLDSETAEEVSEALVTLGYKRSEINTVLPKVDLEKLDSEKAIREVLRFLAK